MPLKKFDHSNWKWLALLMLAPAAMMLITSGRRKQHSKGYLTKDDGRDESAATTSAPKPSVVIPTTTPSTTIWTTSMAPVPPVAPSTTALPSTTITVTAVDLTSPTATVDSQMMLLRENRDEEFRKTFLPSVPISADQIDACKKKIASSVVKPDWEMAEEQVVNGHRVKRVSMFGKSMTGFHDMSGKWLADYLWCVPVGVP